MQFTVKEDISLIMVLIQIYFNPKDERDSEKHGMTITELLLIT